MTGKSDIGSRHGKTVPNQALELPTRLLLETSRGTRSVSGVGALAVPPAVTCCRLRRWWNALLVLAGGTSALCGRHRVVFIVLMS